MAYGDSEHVVRGEPREVGGMKTRMTDTQKQALETYQNLCIELGYPPTVRELQERLGLSSISASYAMLQALRKRGYSCPTRGQARDPDKRAEVFAGIEGDNLVQLNQLRALCARLKEKNEQLEFKIEVLQSRDSKPITLQGALNLVRAAGYFAEKRQSK